MDDARDLEDLMARMPRPSGRELLAEVEAARRAAETALPEPTTLPMPESPYPLAHPLGGTLRFPCPLGCGWHHDVHPGRAAAQERLVLPADPERLEAALTAQAEVRAVMFRAGVEAAIAEHFEQAHPGR
ncbi:hypothetical protein ACH46L_03320 [Streptomyces althioticus]|uniref:hypothetical protein n=1 Tax=Streptomyces althioticus TaxID=83380 RepID=UPI00379B54D9